MSDKQVKSKFQVGDTVAVVSASHSPYYIREFAVVERVTPSGRMICTNGHTYNENGSGRNGGGYLIAPTDEMLEEYRKNKIYFSSYKSVIKRINAVVEKLKDQKYKQYTEENEKLLKDISDFLDQNHLSCDNRYASSVRLSTLTYEDLLDIIHKLEIRNTPEIMLKIEAGETTKEILVSVVIHAINELDPEFVSARLGTKEMAELEKFKHFFQKK